MKKSVYCGREWTMDLRQTNGILSEKILLGLQMEQGIGGDQAREVVLGEELGEVRFWAEEVLAKKGLRISKALISELLYLIKCEQTFVESDFASVRINTIEPDH